MVQLTPVLTVSNCTDMVQLTPVLTVNNPTDMWYSWHQY